ncbi:polyphosphate--glucose phosphotransferase [uncultured Arsenicicoccus sp.]|uniref:polyphosphate--glucose phosphotransferase n=1 Tax=uncultured Arsenicicoccus sp. TaxID=491339 RepID=UPI0025916309|nr:ROK family protein [uncultured Arsenicicoccus sp.]
MTSRSKSLPLGIDVGGSGIKGAPVDLETGEFAAERVRIPTPEESTPEAVADVIAQIIDELDEVGPDAPVGITVPGVVTHGVVRSAANIDKRWLDCDADKLFTERLGRDVHVVNDADAAGVAEVRYGAARGKDGFVILTTLGTGIGIALIHDGVLIPNAELGHLELDGRDAETRASNGVREAKELSWEEWAERLQRYYSHLENLLWPDLFVVGGGVSKKSKKFLPLLDLRTPIIPATLLNSAGIVGAAALAADEAARRH